MKKIHKKTLKNSSIKKKMLVAYLVCILLPLCFLSASHCFSIIDNIKNNSLKDIEVDVTNVSEDIETVLDKALILADIIYYDEDINSQLQMTEGSLQDFIDNAKSLDLLSSYVNVYDFVESIKIYSDNEKLFKSDVLRYTSSIEDGEQWYKQYISKNKNYQYILYYDNEIQKSMISIVRMLNAFEENVGILKIDISYYEISRLLRYDNTKGEMFFLNDKKECIAVANNSETDIELYSIVEREKQSVEREIKVLDGYKIYCRYTNTYSAQINRELVRFWIIMLSIFAFAFFVGVKILYPMVLKINELRDATLKMQKGEFVKVSEGNVGDDEIAELTRGFNCAVDKIDNLINEVYYEQVKNAEIEKDKRTAEFKALQNQINPHFIFNVLESLHFKLFMRGDIEASKVIRNMAFTFRKLLDWKSDYITFEEEMSFIKAFIELHCFNAERDISVRIDIADNIKTCKIPKMSVQIFVENAFKHGLEKLLRKYKCVFAIKAFSAEDRLIVKISDSGCGMDKELVDALNSGDFEFIKKHGTGIFNALTRMKQYFKNDICISVISIPYDITEITLDLPMETDEER